jgi:hypothetical protein
MKKSDQGKKMKKGQFCFFIGSVLLGSMLFFLSAFSLFAGTAPALEIINPARGEEIPFGGDVVIALSVYDPDADTDITTVRFEMDDRDVTRNANISALLITYTFEETTKPGRHTYVLTISDREGNTAELESYFTIIERPKKEKKYTASGSIRAGIEYDNEADQNTVGIVSLDMYGRAGETIDYSLMLEATNEKSSDEQRLSVYRLDLSSPIGSMVLGDATPVFSSYMIDGKEVFGVHLMPQFGAFGFELLFGQTYKAVEDPETEIFKQMAYGGRITVGNMERFLWGLSFLKVKDNKDSITAVDETPKDNIVLGTDFSFSMIGGKVRIKGEANESLYNEDITDGASDFEDRELPFDPKSFEWLFTINEHMVPLVPGFSSLAAKLALDAGPFYNNTLNAEFSYVGASYYSLGNETLTNDKAGFRMWDTIWMLNRRLYISLSYQNYWDNLQDTLTHRTNTVGYSGSTYIYPTDFLTVNAGVDLLTISDDATVDSTNTTLNGGISQNLELWVTNSNLYFSSTASLFNDRVDDSNSTNDFTTRLGLVSYFMNLPLDTKAVVGYDFGDSRDSLYLEARGGYHFLRNESLYASLDAVYETGPEELDLLFGLSFDTTYDIVVEGTAEYFSSPSASDVLLSVYATKEF